MSRGASYLIKKIIAGCLDGAGGEGRGGVRVCCRQGNFEHGTERGSLAGLAAEETMSGQNGAEERCHVRGKFLGSCDEGRQKRAGLKRV
jgi:hypothetical protein